MHKEKNILPYTVRRKFTEAPFLFIGYSLQDINLQLIRNILGKTSGFAVFPHLSFNTALSSNDFEVNKRLEYIARNFHNRFKIYTLWGTAEEFAMELRNQLEKYI